MSSSDTSSVSSRSLSTCTSESDVIDEDTFYDFEGKIVEDYNIVKLIGRGSYSGVWLGYCIGDSKFYAIKIQNPEDYKDGVEEINILKKLPQEDHILRMKKCFVKKQKEGKFLCSVYDLHYSNLDGVIRKGNFGEGLPIDIAKNIFKQIATAVKTLHTKCKMTHCDLKTDNILIKGINPEDKFFIDRYIEYDFLKNYTEGKQKYWCEDLKKDINKIKKMKTDDKLIIRKSIHKQIVNKINDDFKLNESQVDSKKNYPMDKLDSMNITIADFGATCTEDEFYENQFGTRYYMSPEVILMGNVSEKIDIWALGCILYELINGQFLFDPDKDKTYSRDYYHLIEISKVSGRFSKKFLKTTKHYKKFFERTGDIYDTEFREYYDHNELFDKVKDEKVKGLVIDLISKMLKIDPKERISITDILSHEWLNDNNNANNNLPLNTT